MEYLLFSMNNRNNICKPEVGKIIRPKDASFLKYKIFITIYNHPSKHFDLPLTFFKRLEPIQWPTKNHIRNKLPLVKINDPNVFLIEENSLSAEHCYRIKNGQICSNHFVQIQMELSKETWIWAIYLGFGFEAVARPWSNLTTSVVSSR